MEIRLRLFSILRERLPPGAKGRAILTLEEGTTLAGLLDELGIERKVVISVNGAHELDKLRQLHDGDEVKIFAAVSGG